MCYTTLYLHNLPPDSNKCSFTLFGFMDNFENLMKAVFTGYMHMQRIKFSIQFEGFRSI